MHKAIALFDSEPTNPLAPPPLRVQELGQVGIVGCKPLPGGLELRAVLQIAPLAFGLEASSPAGPSPEP